LQLGLEKDLQKYVKPQKIQFFEYKKVTSIHCGGYHSIVIVDDTELYSFGNNEDFQLLNNENNKNSTPKQQDLNNIISIACGEKFTCVLKENGNIYLYGK
jgi:alpha-tubulin suppressor-like RCC1 family protein